MRAWPKHYETFLLSCLKEKKTDKEIAVLMNSRFGTKFSEDAIKKKRQRTVGKKDRGRPLLPEDMKLPPVVIKRRFVQSKKEPKRRAIMETKVYINAKETDRLKKSIANDLRFQGDETLEILEKNIVDKINNEEKIETDDEQEEAKNELFTKIRANRKTDNESN